VQHSFLNLPVLPSERLFLCMLLLFKSPLCSFSDEEKSCLVPRPSDPTLVTYFGKPSQEASTQDQVTIFFSDSGKPS
jgi:hypothetical protein